MLAKQAAEKVRAYENFFFFFFVFLLLLLAGCFGAYLLVL